MKIPYENLIYSDFNIPIRYRSVNSKEGKTWADAHFHEEIEIVYMAAGSLFFTFVDETVELKAGEIMIINSLVPHYTYENAQKNASIQVLQFHPELIMNNRNNFLSPYFFTLINKDIKPYNILTIENEPELKQIPESLRNIGTEFDNRNIAYELSVMSHFYKVLMVLFRNDSTNLKMLKELTIEKKDIKKLDPVFAYVKEHYSEEICVDDVARLINYSNQYFCRIFKETTNKTFVEYLNHFRISEAEKLLINTPDTIYDIYIKTGFSSFSYFNRVFKKITGYTPSQYRTLLKNQGNENNIKTASSSKH